MGRGMSGKALPKKNFPYLKKPSIPRFSTTPSTSTPRVERCLLCCRAAASPQK